MTDRPPPVADASSRSLRPGSVVPLPRAKPEAGAGSGRWWAVALGTAVLLLLGGVVAVVVRETAEQRVAAVGRFDPGVTGPAAAPTNPTTPPAQPGAQPPASPSSPPASPSSPPTSAPVPPPGYQVHHEAGGYWVAIPKGWQTDMDRGARQWWGDLSRTDVKLLFVTIKVVATAQPTARAVLTSFENGRKPGPTIFYHRVQLADRPRLPGAGSVADLEFTDRDYAEGAQTWHYHTLIRAVVTPGGRLYTIEFSILHNIYNDSGSTESDWRLAVPTVRKIAGSFRLG